MVLQFVLIIFFELENLAMFSFKDSSYQSLSLFFGYCFPQISFSSIFLSNHLQVLNFSFSSTEIVSIFLQKLYLSNFPFHFILYELFPPLLFLTFICTNYTSWYFLSFHYKIFFISIIPIYSRVIIPFLSGLFVIFY